MYIPDPSQPTNDFIAKISFNAIIKAPPTEPIIPFLELSPFYAGAFGTGCENYFMQSVAILILISIFVLTN